MALAMVAGAGAGPGLRGGGGMTADMASGPNGAERSAKREQTAPRAAVRGAP